ncbi:MAG: elongation factor G [Deltaproteobacteria bacterium]|nr:elongation factor G [Deltaproteobacteria bacterium]
MKRYETKDIRNVVFVAHGGAGKTSLAEAFLYDARAVTRLGVPGTDASNFDYEPEEVKHHATLQTSIGYVEWQKKKINILDTPGDQNFLVDTKITMQVAADAVVVVVSCPDGVQVVTDKVWQLSDELGLPRAIFVNKMDRERADFDTCVADIKKSLSEKASPIQLPIGKEGAFEGIMDLLSLKAFRFVEEGTVMQSYDLPSGLAETARKAREKLIEDIASSDDVLLEKYLGTGELSDEEIQRGLAKAFLSGGLIPVLCGSAGRNIGMQPLMDLIANTFPAPDQRPARPGVDDKGHAIERSARDEQPFAGRVFKTIGADIGKISLVRVLSGKLTADSNVVNSSKDHAERAGALYALIGKKRETVSEVAAGDIIGLAKLKVTKTGDTLCDEKSFFRRPDLDLPQPVIKYAVQPKSKGDEDKLGAKLHDIQDEDIALRVERDRTSKEILLCGMGQSHIEVTVEKLRRLGIEVTLALPKIPYLETIKGRVQNVEGKHKKQTGGKGQFGVCYLHLEPLARGTGFEFVDAIVGGAIPRQFLPAVEKGIRDRMTKGVIAGYPVTDVKVTVIDGKYHDVDSDSRSFEIAGSKGFQAAFKSAKPLLLEPVMEVEITCPEEYMGDIMGDINSRRGRVLGMESKGKNQVIKAHIPMSETLKYSADLRSMTGGRGSFSLAFSHYDELPSHLADKVIAEAKLQEEED